MDVQKIAGAWLEIVQTAKTSLPPEGANTVAQALNNSFTMLKEGEHRAALEALVQTAEQSPASLQPYYSAAVQSALPQKAQALTGPPQPPIYGAANAPAPPVNGPVNSPVQPDLPSQGRATALHGPALLARPSSYAERVISPTQTRLPNATAAAQSLKQTLQAQILRGG